METWFWILGWSLSILTITGNGFIIFLVCNKRHLRTRTNAFIVSLAVADFCVGITGVAPKFVCEVVNAYGCNYPSLIGSITWRARNLFAYSSVLNLCSLVLDRYIAVVKPLKYLKFMSRRRIIQMVSLSWIIPAVLITVSALNEFVFDSLTIFRIYFSLVMTFEVLPSLMLLFCFFSMLIVVCKLNRAARLLVKQLRFNHQVFFKTQEKSAVIMMGVVIGLFLVCYAIYFRCSFVFLINSHASCNDIEYKIPILVLNSAINPLAYSFFKKDINKEIKRGTDLWCSTRHRKSNVIFPLAAVNLKNSACHSLKG